MDFTAPLEQERQEENMIILQQMLVLFLVMLAGFFAEKKGVLDEDACKKVSWIVVNIANPSMILASVSGDSRIQPEELAVTVLVALAIFACLIGLAAVLPGLLGVDRSQRGVYRVMTVFSNIGFMGFPLLSALYGKGSLLYAALFVLIYNVLIYTYGILCLDQDSAERRKARMKMQTDGQDSAPDPRDAESSGGFLDVIKKIINVGVLSAVGALILYFGNIRLPDIFTQTFDMFSDLTAPLSMMVIGASFGQMPFRELVTDVRLLIFSGIKLLLIPIGSMWVLSRFIDNPILLGVCLVVLATPVGSMSAMLAKQYDCDSELASRGVAVTTLLSVAAIPAVSAVCRLMGINIM